MNLKIKKQLPKIVLAQSLACTAILASGIYNSNKVSADEWTEAKQNSLIEEQEHIGSTDGAQEAKIEQKNEKVLSQGKCGANTEWKLEEDGTLTISGTGEVNSECWREFKTKVTHLVIELGEKDFGRAVFFNYYNLKTVDIADGSIRYISDFMFGCCSQLEKVNFGNGVVIIGDNAFCNCFKLKDVYMPDTVESVREEAFDGCYSIERVHLSNNLKTIHAKVFILCTMLRNIKIPDSVHRIRKDAFAGCKNLEHVQFQGDKTKIKIHIDAFRGTKYESDRKNTTNLSSKF